MASADEHGSITENFTIKDLHHVRGLVAAAGRRAGLTGRDTGDLVMAVNEMASNALLYAGGRGSVTVRPSPGGLTVEVRDQGPGMPAGVPIERPAPDHVGGRGLWMAHQACRQLSIDSGPRGVTVRMFMPRPDLDASSRISGR